MGIHPDYDPGTYDHDFMLIKLKTASEHSPVIINDGSHSTDAGIDVTVMGWGDKYYNGTPSDVLLEVELDIIDNYECNQAYQDYYYSSLLTDNMICAARPGKDACQGDSGGPLIIKGTDNTEDVLVGVVSFGTCADMNYPGVYALVSEAYNWIIEYINLNDDPNVCDPDEVLFKLNLQTDAYGVDTSWSLEMNTRGKYWDLVEKNSVTYEDETFYEKEICISNDDECFAFII